MRTIPSIRDFRLRTGPQPIRFRASVKVLEEVEGTGQVIS